MFSGLRAVAVAVVERGERGEGGEFLFDVAHSSGAGQGVMQALVCGVEISQGERRLPLETGCTDTVPLDSLLLGRLRRVIGELRGFSRMATPQRRLRQMGAGQA